jgi:cold shock protein
MMDANSTKQEGSAHSEASEQEKSAHSEASDTDTITGTVKNFDMNRRFGFITREDGTEVFVHQQELLDGTVIAKGDRVSFQVTEGAKGPRAASVRKL